MKRSTKSLKAAVLMLGAVLLVSQFAYADEWEKGPGGQGFVLKMKEKLNLTDDQVTKIKMITEESRSKMEALRKQADTDIRSLKDKVKAGASDKDLKVALDSLNASHQKMQDARRAEMEKIQTILTPLQQAKVVITMDDRKGKFGGPGQREGKHGKRPCDRCDDND